jgi:hypothetical protein
MNRMGMEEGTARAGKSNRRDSTDRKDRTVRAERTSRGERKEWTDRKKGTGTGRPIEQKFTGKTESIIGQTDRQG